ncbi:uncharacterized protein LOC110448961 isoform X1 [Mizuhopecten yessoensis]|uniref:uncharacterized protein LOC110448961 isoform X1 n=1 Tax=Mizuhopecten yessoensis TaxID=6573 RepID=UPI000B457C5E|nr:uncharacterized protein LOC110448961 isoform X1 [Mizuhopecten yessoensis]
MMSATVWNSVRHKQRKIQRKHGMATLVEKPPDLGADIESKSPIDVDINDLKGIQVKEAKFGKHGVLQIKNATAIHVTTPMIPEAIVKTEKGVIGKPPIVRKSKKNDYPDDRTEGRSTRPGSEITIPDSRSRDDRDSDVGNDKMGRIKSPMSVQVERKQPPNNTPASRAFSDYTRNSGGSTKYHVMVPGQGHIDPLPSPSKRMHQNSRTRRVPAKLIRLATVTFSARTKPASRGQGSSLYYEEPKKPTKVIGWDVANNARPPLRVDMEGPGPCSYSPCNKPLGETNAPSWTFRAKCAPEKAGGARTSWEKPWFQSPHIWQTKTDFFNDTSWPTPNLYKQKSLLGPRQRTMTEAPSFTIGVRKEVSMNKAGSSKEPSPNEYEKDTADKLVHQRGPSYSHQFRRSGTVLWPSIEKTPGPAAYTPVYAQNKTSGPAFTIRSIRRDASHSLGPNSAF